MPGFQELEEWLRRNSIERVDLQFTDVAGYLYHVTISSRLVTAEAMERGFGKLDGSSVKGFKGIEESDLVLKPIPGTQAVLPWYKGVARVLCQVYDTGGTKRFERDPRYAAERTEEQLAGQGYSARIGIELEFFIFDRVEVRLEPGYAMYSVVSRETAEGADGGLFSRTKEAYYTTPPTDRAFDIRLEAARVLEQYFGVPIDVDHHEVAAAGQGELNIRYAGVASMADRIQTVKFVLKNVAARYGKVATFMPKPIYGDNGSGMHVHVSLWEGEKNLFYDPDDEYAELSQFARYFIGGLIEHGRALSAIVSPTVNSYKRLVPGYEAPVYLVWSRANRSAAIRVPVYIKGDWKGKRIEYRPPDPSANPYLALAAIVLAGMDGVRKKIEPGDPIDENVYKMTPERRRQLGIKELPRSLDEALDELESDNEWLKPAFPGELIRAYIEVKREEARKVQSYVSPAEIYYYLNV